MKQLFTILNKLEPYVDRSVLNSKAVSSTNIGWHIHHSLLVIESIAKAIGMSDPIDYKPKFNQWKTLTLLFGRLPRGRAKAPERVQPRSLADAHTLKKMLAATKQLVNEMNVLPTNSFFTHPYFGQLNKQETMKFLIIHTTHHYKIIKDIARTANIS